MKTIYIQPQTDLLPYAMFAPLCASRLSNGNTTSDAGITQGE